MLVRDVMTKNVVTVPDHATYEEASRILYEAKINGAPVVDAGGNVVGMLSDKDLYRVLYPWYKSFLEDPVEYTDFELREMKIEDVRRKPITEFMTRGTIVAHPEDPVMRAGAAMLARRVHRLPVLENGKLVGLITRGDIYRRMALDHLFGKSG